MLTEHDYPGNVRELQNVLQQAIISSTNGIITPDLIRLDHEITGSVPVIPAGRKHSIHALEARQISGLLLKHGGHRRKVADEMGMSERTLYRKLKTYSLEEMGKSASNL